MKALTKCHIACQIRIKDSEAHDDDVDVPWATKATETKPMMKTARKRNMTIAKMQTSGVWCGVIGKLKERGSE